MPQEKHSDRNRRRYIRLDSVFPVLFRFLDLAGSSFLCEWLQGFTNNVSKGGICLVVNNLPGHLSAALNSRQAKLCLEITIPLKGRPVAAQACIAWIKETGPRQYLIGLNYEQINPGENSRIMRYARAKKLFLPFVSIIIFLLAAGFIINSLINIKLIKGNKALVEQLVRIAQESSVAKQKIKEINKEREDLQIKIQALQLRMRTVEEEKAELENKIGLEAANRSKRIGELNNLIGQLAKERVSLQEQLIFIQRKENTVTEDLLRLDKRKANLEKANFEKMYQWLKVHQNPHTGLVMSFEGDSDIANWAFIYDQSLVIQAYTNFSDFERARKLLDFFAKKAKRQDKLFCNSYYASDGQPAEFIIHSGPNIWLGIAILQFTKKTQDSAYLNLAEEIAQAIIALQNEDKEGGIRGGPQVSWYATEHNLDAYAFFNMLYELTAKPQYLTSADKALNWLAQHTYDKTDIPIKRGRGDSTIATDTYAWSIAAVGPERLQAIGMNPDRIMEFAEETCSTEVVYARPEGRAIKVRGFDFAPQKHTARGGVVSSEWTAQMVISFKIMANFYYKNNMPAKARAYELKADEYLAELANMVISSPSPSGQGESCLPYATQDYVDTGHGWFTPKGKSTGSVAGTAYALFAYYNYNPLEFKD